MLQTLTRSRFSTSISCMGCGKAGQVQWEENAQPSMRGAQRTLIGVSRGFRPGPIQQSRDPAIVCDVCGTAQPD